MDVADQAGEIGDRDWIVRDISRHHISGKSNQV
jgi:hypothetical protein